MGVAPLHGTINFHDSIRHFWNTFGTIKERIAEQAPKKFTGAVVLGNKVLQALRQIFNLLSLFGGRELYFCCGVILKRIAVYGVDLFFRSHSLIKALAGFITQPFALHHFFHEGRWQKAFAPRIIGHRMIQVIRYVNPNIQAHNIDQAEAGGVGQSDE